MQRAPAVATGPKEPQVRPQRGRHQAALQEAGQSSSLTTHSYPEPSGLLPTRSSSPRTGLTLRPSWEPSPPGASVVVLAGRATHVPNGAGTSGNQRTVTVTRRKSLNRSPAPDLG